MWTISSKAMTIFCGVTLWFMKAVMSQFRSYSTLLYLNHTFAIIRFLLTKLHLLSKGIWHLKHRLLQMLSSTIREIWTWAALNSNAFASLFSSSHHGLKRKYNKRWSRHPLWRTSKLSQDQSSIIHSQQFRV